MAGPLPSSLPPCGYVGTDGLLLFKDFVKVLAGNSEQPGDLGLRLA
jgi:hypothetical protein